MRKIKHFLVAKLSKLQVDELLELQKLAFPNVSDQEAKEDFYHPISSHLLAYRRDELVGWAGIHTRTVIFDGKEIKLGGFGICSHPDWQRKGIASKVSALAMDYLAKQRCDIAFLSIDPTNLASKKLHVKNGFVDLPRRFTWKNVHGEMKGDMGGMIAPVISQELFEYVLTGQGEFHVGDGYW